jgi:soluble epoxide hydrolase / lipid-phosphate phosphatase
MDPSNYKKTVTSRNLTYNYYSTPRNTSIDVTKPTIIFLHGFPCIGADWDKQVMFFEEQGYRVIVPDMLGYGGTDRPMDVQLYQMKLLAKDLIDILDTENIDRIVAVGHDWYTSIAQ